MLIVALLHPLPVWTFLFWAIREVLPGRAVTKRFSCLNQVVFRCLPAPDTNRCCHRLWRKIVTIPWPHAILFDYGCSDFDFLGSKRRGRADMASGASGAVGAVSWLDRQPERMITMIFPSAIAYTAIP